MMSKQHNVFFYNAHGEKSSLNGYVEFDEYTPGCAKIVQADGDKFHAKKIHRSWYLHNDNDIATMSTDMEGKPFYLFYLKGRNCRIEDLDCDDEMKCVLALKYVREGGVSEPLQGYYWYE